jgi:hypothetical protein
MVWVMGTPSEAGIMYGSGNSQVVTLEVLADEISFQENCKANGRLDPAMSVLNTP